MQISGQPPLNTPANSAPNQPGHARFDNKPVQRALCTVVVGNNPYSLAWLEKSLDTFAITKSADRGKSIVIVDSQSTAMLQRYVSGDSTLYQRLQDRGVAFVASKSIMKFVRTEYGNNPLLELLRNMRRLPFVDQGKGDLKEQLRANILKSLCADYAFSRDKQLQWVGVVDAGSLIPIQPGAIASTGKSPAPFSLRLELGMDTSDGCTFRTPDPVFTDIEFLLSLTRQANKVPNWPESISTVSLKTEAHDSFRQLGSPELAEKLTGGVVQIANNLQQVPWIAMGSETKKNVMARGYITASDPLLKSSNGLKNLVRALDSPADLICFYHCFDLRRIDIRTCPGTIGCFENLYQLQKIFLAIFFDPQLRLSLQSLVRDLEKLPPDTNIHLCCGDSAKLVTPNLCQNALSHKGCVQFLHSHIKDGYTMIHLAGKTARHDFSYDVLFHKSESDKLLPSFSSPLMDWRFQASESYLRLSEHDVPNSAMALGKEHADVLRSNTSAFFQLDASWSLECPQRPSGTQPPALLNQSITGFKYGAVAGLADELFSFTVLPTQYTFLYNNCRGFLFGGNIGLALGLSEHIYLKYIEPALPDGLLKTCIRPVASNVFLAAAVMRGEVLSALGSVAGYTAVRHLGKMARSFWPQKKHTGPKHAHKK